MPTAKSSFVQMPSDLPGETLNNLVDVAYNGQREVLEVRATAGNDLLEFLLKISFQIPYTKSQKKEE